MQDTFAGDGGVSQHGGGEQGCGAAVAGDHVVRADEVPGDGQELVVVRAIAGPGPVAEVLVHGGGHELQAFPGPVLTARHVERVDPRAASASGQDCQELVAGLDDLWAGAHHRGRH